MSLQTYSRFTSAIGSHQHKVYVLSFFFLFNWNKWKLLEQRDIWSQAELLGLDFITNLNLRPVLIGFVNVFSKRGLSFKWGWTQLWGNLGQGMFLSGKHMKLSAFSWFRVLLWSTLSIQTWNSKQKPTWCECTEAKTVIKNSLETPWFKASTVPDTSYKLLLGLLFCIDISFQKF